VARRPEIEGVFEELEGDDRVPAALKADVRTAVDRSSSDPAGAVIAARRVVEAVLSAHLLRLGRKVPPSATIEQLRQLAGDTLPKRLLIHVEYVQRLGNHGAHAQKEGIDAHDAVAAVPALAQVVRWYLRSLPRRRGLGRTLLLAATGLVAFAGLGALGVGLLAWSALPSPTQVQVAEPPIGGAGRVEVAEASVAPAPLGLAVTLHARPTLPTEAEATPLLTAACAGVLGAPVVVARVGPWTQVRATCGADPVEGWARTDDVPESVPVLPPLPGDAAAQAAAYRDDALIAADERRWSDARESWDLAIRYAPADPLLREGRAAALLALGQPEAALTDAALCAGLAPSSAPCLVHGARALEALGDPGAEAVLAAARALDPSLRDGLASLNQGRVSGVVGGGGLALFPRKVRPGAQRRAERGVTGLATCRLPAGAPVEVLRVDGEWSEVKAQCGGREVTGFVRSEVGR